MDEPLDKLNFPVSNYSKEQINAELAEEKMVYDTMADLKNNPRYKAFFDQYLPVSVESFIKHYAKEKASTLRYGELYLKIEQDVELRFKTEAEAGLWEIQQKKLFELQCRWRADQVRIPGVDITHDFAYWEHAIKKCPFLTPISREDFDTYLQYVRSDDFSRDLWSADWQSYDHIKEDFESGETLHVHHWYTYPDGGKQLTALFSLPDIRDEKELYYQRAWWEVRTREHPIIQTPQDERPRLEFEQHGEAFIREFESPALLRYYQVFEVARRDEEKHPYEFEKAYELLSALKTDVPIEPHEDWRQAIILAYHAYRRQQLAKALPVVYEEYIFRLENLLPMAETDQELDQQESAAELSNLIKGHILKGRASLGEPQDFNF